MDSSDSLDGQIPVIDEEISLNQPLDADGKRTMERELKYRLGGMHDWLAIKEQLGEASERLDQVNYYYDTADDDIAALKALLRVRCQNGTTMITYKRSISIKDGYYQAVELESYVSYDLLKDFKKGDWSSVEKLQPIQQIRADGVVAPLLYKGEIRTLRLRYHLPSGNILELDRVSFQDGLTDYEIEVETARPAQAIQIIEELLTKANIVICPQPQTKYERFLKHQNSPNNS